MTWVPFQDAENEQGKAALAAILALPEGQQQLVIGEIVALKERAALGLIPFGDEDDPDLKPIRANPDIYELRWRFGDLLLRQYHAEPPERPDDLIELHFHRKDVSSHDDDTISKLQDVEISQAQLRYRGGEGSGWSAPVPPK
jgi:hypothetical protein